MRKKFIALSFVMLLPVGATPAQDRPAETAPKPPQWAPDEFGVGRKHTPNARCNRAIDKLLEENRNCYNTQPAGECEALLKKNSKKMGTYIKSPRCAK
jgi:hypothetical protein